MKKIIFLILCLSCSIGAMAQKKSITGIVIDATGEAVIGASVVEVGTTNGVITDLDGHFSLSVNPNGKIHISYVGYQAQTIDVNGKNTFKIQLAEDSEMLEEVVVTGYGGKQLRSKVTNSIAKVKEETLKQGLFTNPAQALSGAVAGLSVSQTSGDPGKTPTLVLRGGTNLNGTGSPLILIDGQVRSSLADINPDDIESMEVLKDAGATAIYGARANNGVVLVTTKRGKAGRAEVNLKAKFGLNYFKDSYDFMNAGDYLYWVRKSFKNAYVGEMKHPDGTAIKPWSSLAGLTTAGPYGTGNLYFDNDGKTPLDGNKTTNAVWSPMLYTDNLSFLLNQGWQTMIDPVTGEKIIYKNTDIADFNINTPSFSQDYNLSLSGGNDKGNYYAGLGYNKSEGTAVGNYYQRITFTFNADYKLKEWLTSNSSFNFADATWNGLQPAQGNTEANYFSRALSLPPTFRGYNANGEMLLGPNYADGNQRYNFNQFVRDNNTDKFTMNQAFTIDFMKGLSLKLGAIWYYSEEKYESLDKDHLSKPGVLITTHASSAEYDRTLDQTYNAVLSYKHQIDKDHFLDAMLGFEYYDSYNKGFKASGSGAPIDDFMDLEYTLKEEGKRTIDSWHSRQRIMSFFGRVNYDYQSKYLLSLIFRRDGYSKLASENRWGVFPGISAGWVFSKEEFMKDTSSILSFGKLRASFGLNGNVTVGNYTVQGAYGSNRYNGSTGFRLSTIPNPYLLWEKSRTFEVGLDMGFLDNRINASLAYYNRLTSDKLANITLPSTSGVSTVLSNNGKFQNSGFEFDLGFRIIDTKEWKWNLNWNGALNQNKIVALPDNGLERNRQNAFQVYTGNGDEKMWVGGYQEGQRPGDLYLFRSEGLYRSQDEIPANLIDLTTGGTGRPLYGGKEGYDKLTDSQKANALPIRPGDVKWKDVNGDGVIDNYDKVKIGNTVPKWAGGINTTVSWKALTLSARFDYALGFTAVDNKTPWIMGAEQGTYNTIQESKNTWSPDNPNAKYPTYAWADQLGKRNYDRASSMFAYNGDYLAFRELSLSYKLPSEWVRKAKLGDVSVYVTGQNLGYLTEAKHLFSPEKADNNGGYPLPRTVIFGVNVSF